MSFPNSEKIRSVLRMVSQPQPEATIVSEHLGELHKVFETKKEAMRESFLSGQPHFTSIVNGKRVYSVRMKSQ